MLEDFFAQRAYRPNTVASYRRILTAFLADFEVSSVSPSASALRDWLDEHTGWGDNHRWVAFNAIKSFLRWAFGDDHPALKLRLRRPGPSPQRYLTEEQVVTVLRQFDTSSIKGIRDLALFLLFLDTGLRASEMCRLSLRYLNLKGRMLDVIVKGGKWGRAVFGPDTAGALSTWLSVRPQIVSKGVNTVFVSVSGKTKGQPLTRNGLQIIVRRWGEKAGIRLSPHDLRRTFATLATRAGAPERVLMEAGRWSTTDMIRVYTSGITINDFEPYFPSKLLSRVT
ncbi:hypothetical protein D6779_02525 [Candidatus Parcubacteria bacterium]|nr:MAG: hypothetical protein D6779_02525 [Candidatus Parcubacteria bacterium]